MIWRSTLVFFTSLTALILPVESLRAEGPPSLVAQSSAVEPAAADTPSSNQDAANSPSEDATSENQAEEIKAIQQELKNRGYYNGPIDGIYGPMTAEAIRTLRGQEAAGTAAFEDPNLIIAQQESPSPDAAAEPSEAESSEAEPSDTSETDASDVRINAENAVVEEGELNIGDEVSPETGVDTPLTDASDNPQTADAPPSPGLGRLLWPGLALIVAFGSFGVGFVLANRVKTDDENDGDSAWGAIPSEVPRPNTSSETSLNGHRSNNSNHAATDVVIDNQVNESLPAVPTADISATTRLAKVDIIDELVGNLQVADPSKRRKAIWELGQRGNSSAVQHLVNSMVDADSKEKSLILAALSEIGIRSLKPMNRALAIALQDDNPDVRKNAIRDLTRVYDLVTQISQMLGHATEDEDAEVRRTAEWALEQLNRIREAPKLKSSLNNALEASRTATELLPDEVENLTN
ncbi:MAG: HEAT repeat domain-containing protein [Cyanobacteria bacterium P01_H01_bin.21]